MQPPSQHLVFSSLRSDKTPQTDEQSARLRRTTATLNEYYGSVGSVLLASSLPRQMTYYLMPDADYMLQHMNTQSAAEMQWFYMIEPGRPVALYLDFDAPAHWFAMRSDFYSTAALCTAYLLRFLEACYYGVALAPTHYDGEWRLFCASTAVKWSLHAHCRLMFRDLSVLAAVMQNFTLLLRDTLVHYDSRLRRAFSGDACILDMSVYNQKGRPFRLPLCRKTTLDENPLLPLHPGESVAQIISWGLLHPPHGSSPALPVLGEPSATSDPDVPLPEAFSALGASPDSCALLGAEARLCTRREVHAYCCLFLTQMPDFSRCTRHDLCTTLSNFARRATADNSAGLWLLDADHFFEHRATLQSYAATTILRIGMIRMLPMTKATKEARLNSVGHTRLQSKLLRQFQSTINNTVSNLPQDPLPPPPPPAALQNGHL